jgi:hypothetical protein
MRKISYVITVLLGDDLIICVLHVYSFRKSIIGFAQS